nr:hypothetical protein [Tanacetum cinerariifolium]
MQTHASKVDSSKVLDANLVVIESNGTESGKQDTSNNSENYLTHVVDADIKLVNDQIPFAEVKDIKEKDKIIAKTGQNQEQTGSVEKSKVKPDKVKA